MPRSYLVLDIETVPDPALYIPPPSDASSDDTERPFPPLHAHRPIVLGVLWLDEEYRFRRLGIIGDGKDEKGMLQELTDAVTGRSDDEEQRGSRTPPRRTRVS